MLPWCLRIPVTDKTLSDLQLMHSLHKPYPGQQQVAASYLTIGTKFKVCLMPVLKSSADVQHLNNELCFQGQCQEFGFYVYGKDQTPQQVIWVLLKIALKR